MFCSLTLKIVRTCFTCIVYDSIVYKFIYLWSAHDDDDDDDDDDGEDNDENNTCCEYSMKY